MPKLKVGCRQLTSRLQRVSIVCNKCGRTLRHSSACAASYFRRHGQHDGRHRLQDRSLTCRRWPGEECQVSSMNSRLVKPGSQPVANPPLHNQHSPSASQPSSQQVTGTISRATHRRGRFAPTSPVRWHSHPVAVPHRQACLLACLCGTRRHRTEENGQGGREVG